MGMDIANVALAYDRHHQIEETTATTDLQAHLKRHVAEVEKCEAKRRVEDKKGARVLADLRTRLEGAEGRADDAEAKPTPWPPPWPSPRPKPAGRARPCGAAS